MNSEIQSQLEKIAFKRSTPFCYSCYHECPSGRCESCGSDDLIRMHPEIGCGYGADWIIEHLLKTELTPVDLAEQFEESIRDCYPETTKVGWMEFDTVSLMKDSDPISWGCALSDYESQEESEGTILSLDNGSTYFRTDEIEQLIAENE